MPASMVEGKMLRRCTRGKLVLSIVGSFVAWPLRCGEELELEQVDLMRI